MVDLQLADIDRWTDILDVDLAPEAFVDAMLYDLGNPFSFDLSEIDKRRLVHVLVTIYRQKGTAVGIINVIRFFLGLTASISCGLDPPIWILGVSELGIDTILGPGSSWDRYSYVITIMGGATAAQKVLIEQLAEYMQPAHTHLLRIDP
jgi:phage tail-like protein